MKAKNQTSWCGMPPVNLPADFSANPVSAADQRLRRIKTEMARPGHNVSFAKLAENARFAGHIRT